MRILIWLETFVTVVETGSFTAAADALNISKPVVSKQVSQLEQHLGVQLLQRTTRRLHLTEAGEIFIEYARRIMAEANDAQQAVQPLQSSPKGRLRITVPESLTTHLLPKLLYDFQQHYCDMELEVQVSGQFVDLVAEGIDVAIRTGKLDDSTLIARRLMDCRFPVYATPDYWQQHGKPQQPVDLKHHNCLIYTQIPQPGLWVFDDTAKGERQQVHVTGNLHSDNGRLTLDAALQGHGVIKVPSYMADHALAAGLLETALDDYTQATASVYAIYPRSKYIPPKVRVFIDYLLEKLPQDNTHQQLAAHR